MDQKKMQRLLRLLMLLSGSRRYTVKEILKKLDCSERTAYRYLDTLELSGFVLDKKEATFRLQKGGQTNSLQKLLHFSEEEVVVLYETLSLIEGTSSIKEQLIRKLNMLYEYKALTELQPNDDLHKIHLLSEAIRNKKQAVLVNYRSSNSDNIKNRLGEPFGFSPDCRAVWFYEYESKSCKQFMISRIQEVESVSRDCENETFHLIPFTDAFRISGAKAIGNVEAALSLKAYNLLTEEFPLAREHVQERNGIYHLKIPIAGYQGVGRFVMGLPGEIEVSGSSGFKRYLKEELKKFLD